MPTSEELGKLTKSEVKHLELVLSSTFSQCIYQSYSKDGRMYIFLYSKTPSPLRETLGVKEVDIDKVLAYDFSKVVNGAQDVWSYCLRQSTWYKHKMKESGNANIKG